MHVAVSTIKPSNYPTLDVIPPTDSPEVQQWIKEVAASGRTIPNITATVAGGCAANPAALADDADRCWWTCGGCTRDSDITTCPDKMTWGLTYDDGPSFYNPTSPTSPLNPSTPPSPSVLAVSESRVLRIL